MAGVYISYRRGGPSLWAAERLADQLRTGLGPSVTVSAVDRLLPAAARRGAVDEAVGQADVVVAVIGADWLEAEEFLEGVAGVRRLDDPGDPVRLEIAAAVERDVQLIPVLVDGVPMPASADLPEDLRPLLRRHSLALSAARFDHDAQRLLERLRVVLDIPTPRARRRRRLLLAAGAVLAVVAAAVAATLLAPDPDDGPLELPPGVVAGIDLGVEAGGLAVADGDVWVSDAGGSQLLRVDPDQERVVATVSVGGRPGAVLAAEGDLWVVDRADGTVTRVDADTDSVVATVAVGFDDPDGAFDGPVGLAATLGAVWVAGEGLDDLRRIDTVTNRQESLPVPGIRPPWGLGGDDDAVWITDEFQGTLSRLDPETAAEQARIELRAAARLVSLGGDTVWVSSENDTVLHVLDEERVRTVGARTGTALVGLAAHDGGAWVVGSDDTVVHLRVPVAGSSYPARVVDATVDGSRRGSLDDVPVLAAESDATGAWVVTAGGVLVRTEAA